MSEAPSTTTQVESTANAAAADAPPAPATASAPIATECAADTSATSTRIVRMKVALPDEPDVAAAVMLWELQGMIYVWAGPAKQGEAKLPHIALGTQSRFDHGRALSATICDYDGGSDVAQGMSIRLTKRTSRYVYVTCDLPPSQLALLRLVEQAVVTNLTSSKEVTQP